MKIAVIGRGKTGSKVIEQLLQEGIEHEVFSSQNPVTAKGLASCDVGIAFVTGEVFPTLVPALLEARLPLVIGATGLEFSPELRQSLQRQKITWVWGTNFSLGMRLVHEMIQALSKTSNFFSPEEYQFKLHEIHHIHKKDGPSGTAKSWGEWLGLPVDISFERIGDVVGDHELVLSTTHEKITLRHQALDRRIFAQGAVWTAKKIAHTNGREKLGPGLHLFEDATRQL